MDLSKQLRLVALIFFIFLALIHSSYSRYHGKRHKRQNGAHMYLPESFIVPSGEGNPDEWSEWSSPSECSRSCGGGVSFQTRECLRQGPDGTRQCSGGSRKYFSCNTQDCSEEEPDFRAQQCSRFDSIPFDGVRYEWVPYTNAPNPCELNCMPRGERFYYRHKAKVADGTRCNDKNLDVCVNGECQPVGCDMMLGSNAREDKCRKCAGDGSSCKTISGLFETNNLVAGYNDILLIPIGATNIILKEVAPSNNYLACRNLTGHYYLNGNWRIDFPRPMHFAGSWWHYQRKPTGFAAPDQLTCSGPTTESIYVVMLIQDRNVGVQYEYSIPETVTKSLPDTYSWTHMEYGPCSASCGGGVQSRNVTCNNRLNLEQVDESLCDANNKPSETQVCGTDECAPNWVEGVWTKCSKACGKDGIQNRTVSCERISPTGVATVVDDNVCLKEVGNKPADTQECNRDVVECPKFHTGPWTPCDKLCGEGKRSRKVTCFKEENGRKKVLTDDECSEEKPDSEETCILAPCEGVDWIISQWSGCDKCGQTKETRTAICGSKSGKVYDEKFCSSEKPELVKPCKSTKCKTQWFTSEWSECSAKCGEGLQSRVVICGEFDGATVTPAADDSKCNVAEKPDSEQKCEAEVSECPGEWFTGPWGECSKACGGGQRTREVLCLANGTKVSTCEESKIEFGSENCNSQACTDDETIPVDTTSRSVEDEDDSGEECDDDEDYDEEDFGVDVIPERPRADIKLGEGVELDSATTTLSSLIMDDLMLSDSPSTDGEGTSIDISTEVSETTVEGSGDDSDTTIASTINVSEGSGDDDLTTIDLVTDSTELDSTLATTDNLQSSDSTTSVSESSTDLTGSTESSSEASSESVTGASELPSSTSGEESTLTSEDLTGSESTEEVATTQDSTETSSGDTSDASTDISEVTTSSTDIGSTTDSASTLLPESSSVESSSEGSTDISSTVTGDSTISDTTAESTTGTGPDSSTETTSDSSTETTLASSTDVTSDRSTETTSESSTETTSDSSTESTSESSTESTSDISTESTSEGSTETTSESSTETTSESSTETTLDGSTETTLSGSTDTTLDGSTETTSESSTETPLDSSTETTTGISGETTLDSSTESTLETSTQTTLDFSTETTTDIVSSSTDVSTEDTSITEDSSSDSSSSAISDETTIATSDITDDSTTVFGSTEDHSDSSTDSSTDLTTDATSSEASTSESSPSSTETGLTDTSVTTDETTESSRSSDSSSTDSTTDVTTELSSSISDVSTTTLTSEDTSSTDIGTTEVIDSSQSSSAVETSTVDIWSSETTEVTDEDGRKTTPNTLEAALDKETKPRKCKAKKPKKENCASSKFGCCPDKRTHAKGPFGLGCPVIKTCSDSEFGCCPDGLSPAEGKNNEGCPKSLCAETLFGCCPDNFTAADGEDDEGCPEPTTEPPTTTVTIEEDTEETTLSSETTDITESSSEVTEESSATDSTETETEPEIDTTESPAIKTVKSCSFNEFGCCPDGKTNAQGENFKGCDIVDEKDCSKSVFGCCRDRKSSALGPNEEGCALCTQEPYGCCPDGVTPAHGQLGEGCCLNTQYGCCPDNINAARGPNFESCDCKYTPYGCCPDNTTAARGYDNKGCDCESSPFGCCPDKLTPSPGEKFAGCPCHTMQFGCCPDGITIPQGPHHYGCHCSQTQYKCCSDEKTPAKGPNFEGCTCAESKFGCCPDGTTEAQGDKFEGCEIVQESPQKACGLPKETGNCSNFTIKYFFDTSYGACARFWYGGCDGNGNRFETESECRKTCQEYKGKDTCLLPKSAGPCPGFQKKWYFNSERSRCEEFNYGGCYGTSNRFDSLDECKAQCSVEESLPPCEQPVDQGPCEGNFERWHYDNETDVCRQFTYGGCKGNKNNFATEHACKYHCREPGVHKELCALPKESGKCGGNHARWHFSESDQKCLPFYYTGCGGNKNNFQSMESCEEHCPKKIAKDVCELPAEVGECQNYTPSWYWDTKDLRCRQFYYGGCGGNGNRFAEEEECLQRCERKPEEPTTPRQPAPRPYPAQRPVDQPPPAVDVEPERVPESAVAHEDGEKCFQPSAAGDCEEYLARWFYNADEGICDQFIYTGCNGNGNSFDSEEECENNCFHVHSTCKLPPVYGRCNESTTRWHYDEQSKRCYEFEFSGCRGNRNNFFNEQECMDYCQNTHPEEEAPHTEGYSQTAEDQCDLPVSTGDCRDNIFSWYYNKEAKQCEGFYYSGCNGNANRFESREQCDRQCGHFKDVDVCNDPLVVGSCTQWETRFYYDKVSQTCEPFTYGGCGGSGNRFVDKAECQSVCILGKEPTDNRAICLLPPNVGKCSKATASERRWYYDDDRGTCVPFIYSGCSGNQNNFRSPNACINFCANQTDQQVEIEPRFGDPEPTDNKCVSYEDHCRSLQCPFGTKTDQGQDGCRRCKCLNPCESYSCPNGEKCAVDVSNDPSSEERFIPICRQVNKAGICPQLSNSSVCRRECYDDADCRDDNKCCAEGCSHVCVRPHQPQAQTTTLSPPAPRTEVIYPGESPAALEPKKPEEVEVTSTSGSVAVLRCFATGNPPPIVTWRRGAVLVDTNKGRYILTSSGDLTIVQVHQSDSGSYICVATNGLGAPVSREVNLQVSDTKKNIPAYIYGPRNVTQIVTLRQPAVIRCPAGGYPKPHVNWWRGKNRMALTTARYDTQRDYSLVFRSIELSDLGPYECSAWTGHGKPASIVVILKAVGPVHVTNRNDKPFLKYILNPVATPTTSKPAYPYTPTRSRVRPPPPQVVDLDQRFGGEKPSPTSPPTSPPRKVGATAVIRRDSSNNYTVGSDVVLNCDVGGYPAPNVTWSKDSKQVLPSNRIQITENPHRLVIYGVTAEDSGYYRCTARNTFTFNTSEEHILIESGVYVRPDCTDNKYFANCAMIVKGKYCSHEYYGKFCCRSCTLAGQLPGGHPNSL